MTSIIERNVSPNEVPLLTGRSYESFREDVEYLAREHAELLRRYPDEWVAIFNGQVVAHNKNKRSFAREIKAAGFKGKSPVVEYLTTRPMTLIL